MLKYSKRSHNLAVNCLALADFCNVDVTTEISSENMKLTLELSEKQVNIRQTQLLLIIDGGITLTNSASICSYFVK